MLKLIIDKDPDPNIHLNIANVHGRTALIHASMEGNKVALDLLIEQNVHVNTLDSEGHTALDFAFARCLFLKGWVRLRRDSVYQHMTGVACSIVDSLIKHAAQFGVFKQGFCLAACPVWEHNQGKVNARALGQRLLISGRKIPLLGAWSENKAKSLVAKDHVELCPMRSDRELSVEALRGEYTKMLEHSERLQKILCAFDLKYFAIIESSKRQLRAQAARLEKAAFLARQTPDGITPLFKQDTSEQMYHEKLLKHVMATQTLTQPP